MMRIQPLPVSPSYQAARSMQQKSAPANRFGQTAQEKPSTPPAPSSTRRGLATLLTGIGLLGGVGGSVYLGQSQAAPQVQVGIPGLPAPKTNVPVKGTIYKSFKETNQYAIIDEATNRLYLLAPADDDATMQALMSTLDVGRRVKASVDIGGGVGATRWGRIVTVRELSPVTSHQTLQIEAGILFRVADTAFNQRNSFLIQDPTTKTVYRIGKANSEDTAAFYTELQQAIEASQRVTLKGELHPSDNPAETASIIVSEFSAQDPQ